MIIDVHTHAFPDSLAPRALGILTKASTPFVPNTDGTMHGLLQSMDTAGIERSFVCSIATRPQQASAILQWSLQIASERIVPFGSVHPESPAWEQEIDAVADAGLIGLKLHAQHQGFVVDDRRLLPFYEKVASRGLVAIIHGGHDIGFPGNENSLPESIARLHRMVPSLVIIAAHFGGWRVWEQAAQHLLGLDIYLDTSLCDEIAPATRARILAGHSRERIVFGSDSPWQDQGDAVAAVLRLPIDADYKDRILGGNALRLCTQRR